MPDQDRQQHRRPTRRAPRATRRGASYYEYRTVTLPPDISRGDVRRLLTEEAEYGRWELARTRLYLGGMRRVWLRRKTMRVESTLF